MSQVPVGAGPSLGDHGFDRVLEQVVVPVVGKGDEGGGNERDEHERNHDGAVDEYNSLDVVGVDEHRGAQAYENYGEIGNAVHSVLSASRELQLAPSDHEARDEGEDAHERQRCFLGSQKTCGHEQDGDGKAIGEDVKDVQGIDTLEVMTQWHRRQEHAE